MLTAITTYGIRKARLVLSYVPLVELIGRRTAELHLALAANRSDPGLAPEPFSRMQQRSLCQAAFSRLKQKGSLIRPRRRSLPSEPVWIVDREVELDAILSRNLDRKIAATRIRCHSDCHLGQILCAPRRDELRHLRDEAAAGYRTLRLEPAGGIVGRGPTPSGADWSTPRGRQRPGCRPRSAVGQGAAS